MASILINIGLKKSKNKTKIRKRGQLGKPQGSDERNDKTTFVSLLGLEAAKTEAHKHVSLAKSVLHECQLQSSLLTDLCDYIVERTH